MMSPVQLPGSTAIPKAWVAVVAALVAYGSLYPFQIVAPASLSAAWTAFVHGPRWWTSLSDVVGNWLLCVPLGLVVPAVLPREQRTPGRLIVASFLAIAFTLLLQVAQIWIPTRSAALSDAFWNIVGYLSGLALGPLVDRLRERGSGHRFAPGMPHLLLLFWLGAELAPLVPSLDWQGAKDALRGLRNVHAFSWSLALASAARTLALGAILGAMFERRRSVVLLAAALLATVLAKPLIVGQSLTAEDLAGYAVGLAAWVPVARWLPGRQEGIVAALLLVSYSLDELRPFALSASPTSMNWVPFASILTTLTAGSLANIFRSLFTFATIGWLVSRAGGMLLPTMTIIALWVGALEAAQMWIEGRTSDISEPIIAVVAGVLVWMFTRLQPAPTAPRMAPAIASGTAPPLSRPTGVDGHRGTGLVLLLALWVAATYAIRVLIRLPGIPYEVPEMFLGGGHPFFVAIFVLSIFWIGAGSAWLAARLPTSRPPVLTWPAYAFAAAMISLALLYASVAESRIEKISGSNNLWWFVINRDIWGAFAHQVFALLGQEFVSMLERPVRYAALYIPVPVFIAAALLLTDREQVAPDQRGRTAVVLLSAVPCLWLCKGIAFDWSSTDNLNELIARDGKYGWGGGGYLYALLGLFAFNVALLTRLPLRALGIVVAATATGVAIVGGWELFNLGLEPHVEKYGQYFSGAQFLLGPDRKNLLSERELFLRWTVVYLPAIFLIAAGARYGWPLLARIRWPGRFLAQPVTVPERD